MESSPMLHIEEFVINIDCYDSDCNLLNPYEQLFNNFVDTFYIKVKNSLQARKSLQVIIKFFKTLSNIDIEDCNLIFNTLNNNTCSDVLIYDYPKGIYKSCNNMIKEYQNKIKEIENIKKEI